MSPHGQEPEHDPEDAQIQPIETMQEIRIVAVPDRVGVKEEPDPSKVLVVKYDAFMSVVNELGGSTSSGMRRFAEKLQAAVDGEAIGQFAQAIARTRESAKEEATDAINDLEVQLSDLALECERLQGIINQRDAELAKTTARVQELEDHIINLNEAADAQ